MAIELEQLMLPDEAQRIGLSSASVEQRQALHDWGMRMYSLGEHIVADIQKIKYNGRLIVLSDGTRWEVDDTDATTTESWDCGDKVVVIDDEMYKLDELEKVDVERDSD